MVVGLEREIIDQAAYNRNIESVHAAGVTLPRIADLADPANNLADRTALLADVDPDTPAAGNLFRVHWHNGPSRRHLVDVPAHIVLDTALTGVDAKIIIAVGDRFPMVRAHKVLAAYGCLVPRLLSGVFDVSRHRAVWPSTGNYCRGGVAISRILGCRSVAVLPEGMSRERFQWLENWTTDPADILRTPGTESNVKEIYDACHALSKDPENIILNQFAEFGNYIIHRAVSGPAFERMFKAVKGSSDLKARAFVSATGSAGTIAAGDYLKDTLGAQVCAVEATECPTLLYNGYGEHNIQGIGDKHVPFIHNVMNTDFVIGVSDQASDNLNLLFNTTTGRKYLSERAGMDQQSITALGDLGLSSIANIVGAIKYAKYMGLKSDDAVLTVATDGAEMYETELSGAEKRLGGGGFDALKAAEVYGRHMLGAATDHMIELDRAGHERIFNLGYYTWVEQQGVELSDFEARRDQAWWDGLMDLVPAWDGMIDKFNSA
ncbi:MAG: pyridoxal-phosphate dependent enzyme [Rhodospirillaceae bacterium]|jgi:cysteine synthase|nr:pyridoxal-phosphate dependent enzyme [Rhodospirillaceae bacterium]MBT5079729.1 pyridoxal-phosphate dependent enzyme [Rhodospirillaceae bacterium]MBT5526302.1 pyridoxal-phosphate dependent enzyme [Rhodospirillaceae bacterium]MBT5881542.1 pyridoxal-phosphate dependent enzyme [Rhodospirillaceae bacterium]MBT6587508.1 pyridoxal-phosphate dependent enzyme [Rhodospirillaceae bacterium]